MMPIITDRLGRTCASCTAWMTLPHTSNSPSDDALSPAGVEPSSTTSGIDDTVAICSCAWACSLSRPAIGVEMF
jgi:hypothetical protein